MVGHYPSSLSPSLPLLPVTLPFKAAKHFSLKNRKLTLFYFNIAVFAGVNLGLD